MKRSFRRTFLGAALLCGSCGSFAASVVPPAGAQTNVAVQPDAARRGGPVIPPDKGYVVQEIKDRLYWVTDGAYNTMFLVSDEGVVAVDPLPTLGARYLKAIAEVTDKPITHVVYSHSHTDHIGAANLFPKNAKIIAHRHAAEILARRRDPRRPPPAVTFDDFYHLDVGGQLLELTYKGNNHEPSNIFIHAPKQKVLMLVDVVYPGYMPYKNLGITEDVQGLMQAHRDVLGYDFETLVAGHVTRLGTRRDAEVGLEFLEDLHRTAAAQMAALPFPAYLQTPAAQKMMSRDGRSKWDLHNEYEKAVGDRAYALLAPRWRDRLLDTETYLRENCWAMINALTVHMPPATTRPESADPRTRR